jgi:hypothetical protein
MFATWVAMQPHGMLQGAADFWLLEWRPMPKLSTLVRQASGSKMSKKKIGLGSTSDQWILIANSFLEMHSQNRQ